MLVKTHLIVTDQWDDYEVKWVNSLSKISNPILDDKGYPTFAIISNKGRMEIKTFDMAYLEQSAKRHTFPRGRGSVTQDKGYIYIKTKEGEVLLGIVIHSHYRKYAPMFDDI